MQPLKTTTGTYQVPKLTDRSCSS